MRGIKRLLRILAVLALAVTFTIIQGYWAMGGYHDQLSSTCIRCSLIEELFWSGLMPAAAMGILLAVFHRLRPVRRKQAFTAVPVMMVLWLLADREIFISRVSSWSTFTKPEEWAATVHAGLVPILATGAVFGGVFYLLAPKYDHKTD